MSFSDSSLRAQTHERFGPLIAAGPGVHPYALDAAEKLVKEDPALHHGLVAAVEIKIGPQATKAARKAIEWFRRNS
jgi:hypothetical protein